MPLDPVELARQIAGGLDEEEDTRESPENTARRLAGLPPVEEEGLDIFQPIRTFFGASQGIGGKGLGYLAPEAYEQATEEMKTAFGVTEGDPWYEEVEALPGGGDVLAQLVPKGVRESLVGRGIGPVSRMAGNILFDPTTYIGGAAAKGAVAAVKGVKGGAAALKSFREAEKGRKLIHRGLKARGGDSATRYAQRAAREKARDASRIADLVLEQGTPAQQRAYRLGIGMEMGGPLALGVGAAAAYGPEVVGATVEGAKRTVEAEGAGEKAAEAANTLLMAGLSALMTKGVIDAAQAGRAWNRHLKDTKQIPETIERMESELAEEAVPRAIPEGEAPTRGPGMLSDEDARLLDEEYGEVPAPEPTGEIPAVPEKPAPVAEVAPEAPPREAVATPEEAIATPIEKVVEPEGVTPEAPPGVEPSPEPAVPKPEAALPEAPPEAPAPTPEVPVPEKPVEPVTEAPVAPEAPTPAPEAPAPVPEAPAVVPDAVREIWENKGFQKAYKSALGKEKAQVAAGKLDPLSTPMDRVQEGMVNNPDFQREVSEGLAKLKKEGTPTPGQLMGLVRRIANKKNKQGHYVYAIKAEKLGAEGGSILGEAPLETATQAAEKVGKPVGETVKEKARGRGVAGRFEAIQAAVKDQGRDFKEFVYESQMWKKAKKEHRDVWLEYENQMGRGIPRAQAVKNVQKKFAANLSAGRISNLLGEMERGLGEEATGKTREKAAPDQLKRIRQLQKEVNFPEAGKGQDAAHFAEAMRQDKTTATAAMGRFLKFVHERDQAQRGLPADVRSIGPLKKFARSLGVRVKAKDDAMTLSGRIATELGLDWDELKRFVKGMERQVQVAERTGPFGLPGFKGVADNVWEHPAGIRLRTLEDADGMVVSFDKHGADVDAIRNALAPIIAEPRITAIDASDAKMIKGKNPVGEALEALGLEPVEDPGGPVGRLTPQQKFVRKGGLLYKVPHVVDEMSTRMEEFVEGYQPHSVDDSYHENLIINELRTQRIGLKVRNQLREKGVEGVNVNDLAEHISMGSYHQVFKLNGARMPDGTGVVMRVGRSPNFAYPTGAQRALVMPILAKGKLLEDPGGPIFYTLHPEAQFAPFSIYTVPGIDRSARLTTTEPVLRSFKDRPDLLSQEYVESVAQRVEMEQTLSLPPGMPLQTNLDAIADLFTRAQRAGLIIEDVTHGPGAMRFDQWGWIPESKPTADMITYRDMNGKDWRLVFSDFGTVFPNPETRAGTIWTFFERNPYFDTARLALKANDPDSRLSMADQLARIAEYEDDLVEGLDLGGGLKNVNNDRIASDSYVARHGELGAGAGRGLRRVVADLTERINKRDDVKPFEGKMDAEYVGITNSPHISGLHLLEGGRGKGRILSNIVEAVNDAKSYDDAVDRSLYTVLHEVTHNKNKGHQGSFQTIENYINNLIDAEGQLDNYRAWVKEGFSEADYNAVRSELVPEFKRMGREHGGRESWREASFERVPVGAFEGGVAPRAYRGRRGQEAPPRGEPYGVRPGRAVQRGREGPPGRVREAPVAGEPAAPRRAEGEAAGPAAGRGTEGAVRENERLVTEVETLLTRGEEEGLTMEKAKRLLDELVQTAPKDKPLKQAYETAWQMAGLLRSKLTAGDRAELRKSLPSPRRAGQREGVWNMLHNPDISDAMKEQTVLFGDLTKGTRSRDKIRHWDSVEDEVKELLGIDTAENWALAFRNKGGGLRDRDALLLKQIHTDLSGKVDYQRERLADAIVSGDEAKVAAVEKDLRLATRNYLHAGEGLAKGMTETARALAIGRKTVRKMDPRMAWEADLKAGLRERMRTRFKDPVVAEEKAGQLFNKMMEILQEKDPGQQNWGEFYKAYRLMTKSKVWPDKALEWYKAGLLGWPSRVANITSNGLFRAVRYVEDGVAGALDATKSALTGSKREVYAGEVGVSMMALRRAAVEAFPKWQRDNQRAFLLKPQNFADAVQRGSIMEDLLMHPGAIEGKFGEFVRFQLKGLGADDELAKHFSRMDTYYRAVYRKLRNGEYKREKGESMVQATERIVTDLRNNYQNALDGREFDAHKMGLFEPMAKEADRIAKSDTFQEDLGNAGRGFQALLRESPALQVFFPFVRTPTNIAKETIKRTPLGLINVARKWKEMTPAQRMSEMSKPLTGTAMGMGIMGLAMTGEITGGGPVDFNERETMINAGWAPYSIRLGDQWVSFQRFEPIAAILGIAADAAEGVRNGDFDTFHTGTLKVLQSAAENVTNKTFMSGMDALFSAISNPKQALGRFTKQMQTSVIPNSLGFVPVGHLARSIDGTYRQTEAMTMDVFYSKVPFLSKTITPQYTPTGEERLRPSSAVERLVSPFARRTVEDGPIAWGAEEVVRVDASPQPPKRYWYGKGGVRVPFIAEEKQLFAKALGKATEVIGTKVIRDPNYLKLPDDELDPRYRYGMKTKQEVLRRIYQKYRTAAMRQIRKDVEARARKLVLERS
jgi:hypothetical protein